MSRIGNKPVVLPNDATLELVENVITVKGPKGTESVEFPNEIEVKIEEKEVVVNRKADDLQEFQPSNGCLL